VPPKKTIDICVFGATGFTGQLVVEYLAEVVLPANKSLRVAIAGRSQAKLEQVKRDASAVCEAARSIEIVVASSEDLASLDGMAARARVLISTVGPYLLHGIPVVEACLKNNADYVDLTGEVPFMRHCIAKYDAVAKKKAVAIVHSCGYDSVPSDIGYLYCAEYARRTHGASLARIHAFVGASRGGASGGTIASMLNMMASVPRTELAASMKPDSLVPDSVPAAARPRERDLRFARYDEVARSYVAPWIMEGVNSRVVRRSMALRDQSTVPYTEVLLMPNAAYAYLASIALVAAVVLLSIPPTRWLLQRFVLPSPGQGPDRQTIVNGFFTHKLIAFTAPGGTSAARRIEVQCRGRRDPGYGWTSRCITECALALLDRKLCAIGESGGGVLTPATAIGQSLISGLERSGLAFSVTADEVAH
jgi:short subunit dehydrogenase-like uncharacterized protein